MKIIDLRSDTVTQPTPAMRKAMAEAEVGDDVYGDDPTVQRLEALAADMVGTEAALFTPSGTQANLIALMCHCQRGDEYIVGQGAHCYKFEGGGAAVLGSIQPQPIQPEKDGTLNLETVIKLIKPKDIHFVSTRLLCLENTYNGKVLPLDYIDRATQFVKEYNLSSHLDGARLFNAAVQQKVTAKRIAEKFDTVSICLSKGLGAPIGSVLCLPRAMIADARRWRKALGGGMRQSGIVAAAGIVALSDHIGRLAKDHENARHLSNRLCEIDELDVDNEATQTNMVFFTMKKETPHRLADHLYHYGILSPTLFQTVRFVTHLNVSRDDIDFVIEKIKDFFTS